MKNLKKIMALLIAMVMVIGMSVSVFAANGSTNEHTITITNSDQIGTHTYDAYQVFIGDYDATSGKLSNITWGSGVNGAAILSAVKADPTTFGSDASSATTPADVAALLGEGTDTAKAKAFAAIVGANLTNTTAGASSYADSKYTISVTGDGYYFVKDRADTVPKDTDGTDPQKGDAETRYILKVTNNVAIVAKSNTVESTKKVDDVNDSTGEKATLQDSADYDIGDKVPYTLTAKLPENYDSYEKYYLQFVDDMSKGLTLDANSVKIYYGESDTAGTTINLVAVDGSSYTGGQKYTYTITDLKAVTAAASLNGGDIIKITYNATLNTNAVIGAEGNPNKYHIVYNNNPNNSGEGKSTESTPDDINIVFTYDIEVDKVTGTGSGRTALPGAAFALYKLYTAETIGDKTAAESITYDNGTQTYAIGADDKWVLVEQKNAGDDTEFTFSGVDDGTYLLVETTTPSGYNSINPSKFTVTATHNNGDTPTFGTITGTNISGTNLAAIDLGTKTKSSTDDTVTGLKTDVVNNEGAVLPSTGGIGTTIFYVLGAVLVIGAGVILIARRRVNA